MRMAWDDNMRFEEQANENENGAATLRRRSGRSVIARERSYVVQQAGAARLVFALWLAVPGAIAPVHEAVKLFLILGAA